MLGTRTCARLAFLISFVTPCHGIPLKCLGRCTVVTSHTPVLCYVYGQVVGWPERPVPRAHHSVTYLRRMIFVFGGVDADDTILGDLHFYDTVTRRWSGEIAREWCCDER